MTNTAPADFIAYNVSLTSKALVEAEAAHNAALQAAASKHSITAFQEAIVTELNALNRVASIVAVNGDQVLEDGTIVDAGSVQELTDGAVFLAKSFFKVL